MQEAKRCFIPQTCPMRDVAEKSMIKVKRLGYSLSFIFLCIGISAAMGHSQEAASDYVAPSQAVPKGKAPAMQVQLLNRGEQTKEYAVIFGEETRLFPVCWPSQRRIMLQVRISRLLAGSAR